MTRRTPWPWLVLFVWSVWIEALVGRLGAVGAVGGWVPDLGLVLLLALEPRLSRREAYGAAVLLALARSAFTADPPVAVLVGTLAAVAVSGALRGFVDVHGGVMRTLLAGILALLHGSFLAAVHLARLDPSLVDGLPLPTAAVGRVALASALAALVAAPALLRLPGLTPLVRTARRGFA